jgi:hypothetical protein
MNAILHPKQPVTKHFVDDADTGLIVRYVGSKASASVTVAANGDLTFKHGAAGAEAVDSTVGASGVIDVSDEAYNTFGEVVDAINASPNWEAYLVEALRADSSNDTLLAMSETFIVKGGEVTLYKDTSVALNIGVRIGKRSNVSGSEERSAAEIYGINSLNTYGSGTSLINVYEIDEAAKSETLIYSAAGGATTVADAKNFVVNGRGSLASSKVGTHLLVKMVGSAACTGSLTVIGATATGL